MRCRMLRPYDWVITTASTALVLLAMTGSPSLGCELGAVLQEAPREANNEPGAKPRMRRFGRLPDWTRQSWFLRRQMDTPWALTGGHVIDVRTGENLWQFDPIPRNANDPQAQNWDPKSLAITGGANAWSLLTVDEKRDLVFIPTSSAAPRVFRSTSTARLHRTVR